ncbi:UNVERIFIED_CONTAM: hypothetical protein DES50_102540 [Williamsia faeni]
MVPELRSYWLGPPENRAKCAQFCSESASEYGPVRSMPALLSPHALCGHRWGTVRIGIGDMAFGSGASRHPAGATGVAGWSHDRDTVGHRRRCAGQRAARLCQWVRASHALPRQCRHSRKCLLPRAYDSPDARWWHPAFGLWWGFRPARRNRRPSGRHRCGPAPDGSRSSDPHTAGAEATRMARRHHRRRVVPADRDAAICPGRTVGRDRDRADRRQAGHLVGQSACRPAGDRNPPCAPDKDTDLDRIPDRRPRHTVH